MTVEVYETRCVIDQAGREQHIKHALSLGLPVCTKEPARHGKIAIVGSGPSVRDYRDELQSFDGEVWAINGAYDFLRREFGITPQGFVGLDPQREMVKFLTEPSVQTKFYIASCSHPDVFALLRGFDVRVWHSNSDTTGALPAGSYAVPGGITCITRAPFLAHLLGWRDVSIYGADCSYDEQPYAYATDVTQCDPKDKTRVVHVNGKPFRTELGLMHQASNLGALETVFPASLTFRCGGMLPEFLKSTKPLEAFV